MFRLLGMGAVLRHINNAIGALKPGGNLGRAIIFATQEVRDYARGITHVRTGALRKAHVWKYIPSALKGEVFISSSVVNPFGERPSKYGPVEHARGGSHAFYRRTVTEAGPQIASRAVQYVAIGLF